MSFTGELAQTKKQAQKNAAMSAWYALKQISQRYCSPSALNSIPEEQEQVVVARFLATLKQPESRDHCPQSNQPSANHMPPMAFLTSFPPTSTSFNACYQFQASSHITPDKDLKKGDGALITPAKMYNPAADSILGKSNDKVARMELESVSVDDSKKSKKKEKKEKKKAYVDEDEAVTEAPEKASKEEKKKKKKTTTEDDVEPVSEKKEKKKKKKTKGSDE